MGFPLPRMQKYCFCLSLRTGCLILGYMSMRTMLFYAAKLETLVRIYIRTLVDVTTVPIKTIIFIKRFIYNTVAQLVISLIGLSVISYFLFRIVKFVQNHKNSPNPEHTKEEYERITLSLYLSLGYLLFVFIYNLLLHLMLLIAVYLNKVTFMRYYIYGGWLLLVLASATVVISTVLLNFFITIGFLKWCITIFYCIIVVRSFLLEIEDQNKPPEIEMENLYIPQRAPQLL